MSFEHSKNIVSARIDANENVIVGDNNVIINLKEAAQYKELQRKLDDLGRRFNVTKEKTVKYPDDEDFKSELLLISKEQNEVKNNIAILKREILKLAEEFSKIPIDTERLRKAKAYFEAGEFDKARAILAAEQLTNELDYLLRDKQQLETGLAENAKGLKDKSSEFLILAHLTSIDFNLPNRFDLAVSHFEKSIVAERNFSNLYNFAYFLHNHKALQRALPFYEEAATLGKALVAEGPALLTDLAGVLNNLSILYVDLNEMQKARISVEAAIQIKEQLLAGDVEGQTSLANSYANLSRVYAGLHKLPLAHSFLGKAMAIYDKLDVDNKENYADKMVLLLQNSAGLYKIEGKLDQSILLFDKALEMANNAAAGNLSTLLRPIIAHIQTNLGELLYFQHKNQKARELCELSLNTFRSISEENPYTYLPEVATGTVLLANVFSAEMNIESAEPLYREAIDIYRSLSKQDPQAYSDALGNSLNNLGALYLEHGADKAAKPLLLEALEIFQALSATNVTPLKEISSALTNLAVLFRRENDLEKSKQLYMESLSINRQMVVENPEIYLEKLALTLNGLANLSLMNKDIIANAENLFQEALDIRKKLAEKNPEVFLPKVAITCSNFSLFYSINKPDREKSLALARESLKYALPLVDYVPQLSACIKSSYNTIAQWGEDGKAAID